MEVVILFIAILSSSHGLLHNIIPSICSNSTGMNSSELAALSTAQFLQRFCSFKTVIINCIDDNKDSLILSSNSNDWMIGATFDKSDITLRSDQLCYSLMHISGVDCVTNNPCDSSILPTIGVVHQQVVAGTIPQTYVRETVCGLMSSISQCTSIFFATCSNETLQVISEFYMLFAGPCQITNPGGTLTLPPEFQSSGIMSCLMETYSSLLGQVMGTISNITSATEIQMFAESIVGDFCMENANLSRCLVDRTENTTNVIDLMLLQFVNVSRIDLFLDLLCDSFEDFENAPACMKSLAFQAPMCVGIYYSNIGEGMTNMNFDVNSAQFYQNMICPGILETVDCISIPLSMCNPELSSLMKDTTSWILADECRNLAETGSNAAHVNPLGSVFVQCGLPFYQYFSSYFTSFGTLDILELIEEISSVVCSHVDWYFDDCVAERLPSSMNIIDRLIVGFLNVNAVPNLRNITSKICHRFKDVQNISSCFQLLPEQVSFCSAGYYGDIFTSLGNLSLEMSSVQLLEEILCPDIFDIIECIAIPVSLCDSELASLMYDIAPLILSDNCVRFADNGSQAAVMNPLGSIFFQCGVPLYSSLIKDIMKLGDDMASIINNAIPLVCSHEDWYFDCVNRRIEESDNFIDRMVLGFLDLSSMDDLRNITSKVCSHLQGSPTALACLQTLFYQGSMCIGIYYSDVMGGTVVGNTSMIVNDLDFYRELICPGMLETAFCMSIPVSQCDSDLAKMMNTIGPDILTDECKDLGEDGSPSARVNPLGSVFVQCGMPLYSSLAADLMTFGNDMLSVISRAIPMACSNIDWYFDCVSERLQSSNNYIDKFILEFLNVTSLGELRDIASDICEHLQGSTNSSLCLSSLVTAAPICTSAYFSDSVELLNILFQGGTMDFQNVSFPFDISTMSSQMITNAICPVLTDIVDCMTIPVSLCSSQIEMLIRKIPETFVKDDCKEIDKNANAIQNVITNPAGSVFLQCAVPIALAMNEATMGFTGDLTQIIHASMDVVCSYGEWYLSCVESRLQNSLSYIDYFFEKLIKLSGQTEKANIVRTLCSRIDEYKNAATCIFGVIMSDLSFQECISNADLAIWDIISNVSLVTQMDEDYIRSTYCPSVKNLTECAVDAFDICVDFEPIFAVIYPILNDECEVEFSTTSPMHTTDQSTTSHSISSSTPHFTTNELLPTESQSMRPTTTDKDDQTSSTVDYTHSTDDVSPTSVPISTSSRSSTRSMATTKETVSQPTEQSSSSTETPSTTKRVTPSAESSTMSDPITHSNDGSISSMTTTTSLTDTTKSSSVTAAPVYDGPRSTGQALAIRLDVAIFSLFVLVLYTYYR